jgi:hypothetical protein
MAEFQFQHVRNVASLDGVSRGYIQMFAALPKSTGGYAQFKRLDSLPGATINRAGRRVDPSRPVDADSRSSGDVIVDLPEGAIIKSVSTNVRTPAFKGLVTKSQIVRHDQLVDITYVDTFRHTDGRAESTFLLEDGVRVSV